MITAPLDQLLRGTRYRARQVLGRGGMGTVVEAEHPGLGKRVAVKVLHQKLSHDARLVDRMRIEAQALARLSSAHIVGVHDLGTTDAGCPFIVMDRLDGRSLRAELRARGVFPIEEAVEYARQALLGLHAAHGVGIVHRDVKLDNLFLCDATRDAPRTVKVLDFGVAKVMAGRGGEVRPPVVPTEEGVAVGTPRFFSPEQARGHAVDARSDVYAMGVALYTMLAGRDPFHDAEGVLALLRAHAAQKPVPISHAAPQPVPAAVERAVMRALEKEPAARFPTALAFAEALAAIAEAAQQELPTTDRAPRADRDDDAATELWVQPLPPSAANASPAHPPASVSVARDVRLRMFLWAAGAGALVSLGGLALALALGAGR